MFKGAGPFEEDFWEEIAIGEPSAPGITLVSKCTRCLVSSLAFLPSMSSTPSSHLSRPPPAYLCNFKPYLDPHRPYPELTFLTQLPNVSPETGERDKAVPYKVLLKFRTGLQPKLKMKPFVGCNGVPKGEGVVRVGDAVWVRSMTR